MKRPVLTSFFALILMATLAVEPRAAQVSPIEFPAGHERLCGKHPRRISNQGEPKQQPY